MKILVLIARKSNLSPGLVRISDALAAQLPEENPDHECEIVIDERGPGDAHLTDQPLSVRCAHIADIRQGMIDEHLRQEHEAVLWIDADIVEYPPDLPSQLIKRSGGGVGAPMVLLEGFEHRFYDTAGFIEDGQMACQLPPWFEQSGPVYELESVGSIYLIPATVYRQGGRHVKSPTCTEHYSVCSRARELGLPVRAFADLVALHANLPWYGEGYH